MNLYTAEVIEKRQITQDIYELDAELLHPQEIDFKAGQCLGLHLGDNQSKRLYSIASVPAVKNKLTFCVDITPMGPGSKFILALEPKNEITLEGPYGGFTADENIQQDLLFIATGVGIAPFKSLIANLLERGFSRKITLLFGLRSEQNIFYFDFFQNLSKKYSNFIFLPTLSQPKGEWNGTVGRVTKYLEDNASDYLESVAYVCGSTDMVKDVRSLLIEKGFSPRQIKIEIFA